MYACPSQRHAHTPPIHVLDQPRPPCRSDFAASPVSLYALWPRALGDPDTGFQAVGLVAEAAALAEEAATLTTGEDIESTGAGEDGATT